MKTIAVVLLLAITLAAHARTTTVTLQWDKSPSPGVVNYVLYYGPAATGSTLNFSVVPATATTISVLATASTLYRFWVVAQDANGLQSAPSNVVLYKTRKR